MRKNLCFRDRLKLLINLWVLHQLDLGWLEGFGELCFTAECHQSSLNQGIAQFRSIIDTNNDLVVGRLAEVLVACCVFTVHLF